MSFQQAIQLLQKLPDKYQQEVLNFIEFMAQKMEKEKKAQSIVSKRRGYGSMKGEIWMAPDFDAPLDDFKDYM